MSEQGLKPCENWKPVLGYEGVYDVSDCGRVRGWIQGGGSRRSDPRIIPQHPDKDGYLVVTLNHKCKSKGYRVARLVLCMFHSLPLPSLKLEASHKDNDRQHNHISNLVWETRQQNEDRKLAHGTRPRGSRSTASKLTEKQVAVIVRQRREGWSLKSLACEYGVTEANISAICSGKTWRHVTAHTEIQI